MTYGYHNSFEKVTGESCPMYASSSDTNPNLNVNASITGWIAAGANPQKVLLAANFYGHTYLLRDSKNNGIGAPSSGGGPSDAYSIEGSVLAYSEVSYRCTQSLRYKYLFLCRI